MDSPLLPGTNIPARSVILGTADICTLEASEVDRLLGVFVDGGGVMLDTAHVYSVWMPGGDGCSERAVATALRRMNSHRLAVATKGGHPALEGYRSAPNWIAPHRVRADIEDSLGRLQVERIDLYYLHRDDLRVPVADVVGMMDGFLKEGLIGAYGFSNWTPARAGEALECAEAQGMAPPVIMQSRFSLAAETPADPLPNGDQLCVVGDEDRAFHARTGLPLAAYAAAAGGFFEGHGEPRGRIQIGISTPRRERAQRLAAEKGVTPSAIALAWLMGQPYPCSPITGTRSPDHLSSNLAAAQVHLTPEECEWLEIGE